jgi:hypothetical protein
MICAVRLYIERAQEASFHFARSTWEARHVRGMRKNIIYEGPIEHRPFLFSFLQVASKRQNLNKKSAENA